MTDRLPDDLAAWIADGVSDDDVHAGEGPQVPTHVELEPGVLRHVDECTVDELRGAATASEHAARQCQVDALWLRLLAGERDG